MKSAEQLFVVIFFFEYVFLLHQATGEDVSFVPGEAFYVHPPEGEKELRLCFTTHAEKSLQEGARRLARALAEHWSC